MRKCLLLATALVVVQIPLVALVVSHERTWGGLNVDEAEQVAVAPDGSVYVAGTTLSFGVGGHDAFLLKYAPDRNLEWQRTYGTTSSPITAGHEFASGVAVGSDGSVYLTGAFGAGNLFLVKFDAAGNLLWQRTWGANGVSASDMAIAPDNSVYIAGITHVSGEGQGDAVLVRFTADGDVVWAHTWGGQFRDAAQGLAVGADGGIYIAGDTNSFVDEDAFLVKFAPDGSVLWQRTWGTTGSDFAFSVATSPGSVYLTGLAGASRDESVFLAKFDASGALLWDKLSGPDFSAGRDVTVATDGHVYVTGTTSDSSGSSDAFVVQFLPGGRARAAAVWGGAGQENGNSIAAAPDGGVAVAGIASAPPYTLARVANHTLKPMSVVQVPAGVVSVATGAVGIPMGIVTIPLGIETFAGATDAAWFALVP